MNNNQEEAISKLEQEGWVVTFTQAQLKLPPAYRVVGGDVYMTRNKKDALFVKTNGSFVLTTLIEPLE